MKNNVYSIAWSRAIAGRIPDKDELLSYLSLNSEMELMEKVTRKLGIKQQYDYVDYELKNYIGTTAVNMSMLTDAANAQLRSLQLFNIKLTLERMISGQKEFKKEGLYLSNGVPILEAQNKRISEAGSLERIKTGEPWIDELFARLRRTCGEQPDAGSISLFLDREKAIYTSKFRQLGAMGRFEIDAYNAKVSLMVESERRELAEALYIGERPKPLSMQEMLSSLQKKYDLHNEFNDLDQFIENSRHELAMRNLVRFDASNSYSALQLLLGFERKINAINQTIKQKINKEYAIKIIS